MKAETTAMSKVFEYPDAKHVLVSGDIHGNFNGIVYKLCVQYGMTDTLLVVAGDCGFGFEKPGYYETVYNHLAGRLRKANNWIAFIRGNHDDPAYFCEQNNTRLRWRSIPDYSVIRACGHDILCVGGAVSIDRATRKEENALRRARGHYLTAVWWPYEAPVFSPEKIEEIPSDIRIDTVITHTSPSFCEKKNTKDLVSWAVMDTTLMADVDRERQTMDELFYGLRDHGYHVRRWFYGHFHQSWCGEREGVLFSMLDIEEFKEIPF